MTIDRFVSFAVVALLAGCTSAYQLTLMPRTSGTLYYGEAVGSGAQANVSITIDKKTYVGTWVYTSPERTTSYVNAGVGFRHRFYPYGGGAAYVDSTDGGEAKALLQAADGSGLRCDFRGMAYSRSGGGTCQDDKGLLYDVQIRTKEYK